MPWTSKDSAKHNRHAKKGKAARQWSNVANSVLKRTGDEGAAIRAANGVIKKRGRKKRASSR